MAEQRNPGQVPNLPGESAADALLDVTGGFDTDGDGHTDTAVSDDGVDLLLLTDLDGDGLADQVLRIGPDGVVRETPVPGVPPAPSAAVPDGPAGGPAPDF